MTLIVIMIDKPLYLTKKTVSFIMLSFIQIQIPLRKFIQTYINAGQFNTTTAVNTMNTNVLKARRRFESSHINFNITLIPPMWL